MSPEGHLLDFLGCRRFRIWRRGDLWTAGGSRGASSRCEPSRLYPAAAGPVRRSVEDSSSADIDLGVFLEGEISPRLRIVRNALARFSELQ